MSETLTMSPTGFSQILSNNKQEMTRIDEFRNEVITAKPRNLAFTGLAVGGVLLAGLFAVQIISGIFAIVVTGAAALGGWYGLGFLKRMDPVIRQKSKNLALDLMVKEARKNAVRQLDNQVLTNEGRLKAARTARDEMGGQVQNLRNQLNPANAGTANYQKKESMVVKLENAYKQIIVNINKGADANKVFAAKVIEYKDMEKFATVAQELMGKLSANGGDSLSDMLSLEAFNEIEENFNTALVSIENSVNDAFIDGGE